MTSSAPRPSRRIASNLLWTPQGLVRHPLLTLGADGRVLTAGGSSTETASPEEVARFLAEELAIGDAEDAIEELRCQLADESLKGTEEYDFLFQATTALQKELLEKRLAHKPFAHEGRL